MRLDRLDRAIRPGAFFRLVRLPYIYKSPVRSNRKRDRTDRLDRQDGRTGSLAAAGPIALCRRGPIRLNRGEVGATPVPPSQSLRLSAARPATPRSAPENGSISSPPEVKS